MTRRTRADWLDEGVHVLASDGRRGLTIERMTNALGVTKGSFYHHFANAREFEEQVVGHWADQFVQTAGAIPPEATVTIEFLDRIVGEAYGPSTAPELAIRAWAELDPEIRPFVATVDAARRGFVRRALASAITDPTALEIATDTLVALLVGALALEPPLPAARVLELYTAFKTHYLPSADRSVTKEAGKHR